MRAVWIGVPDRFLEERHRLGHDKQDELWEGVLHMVPPPPKDGSPRRAPISMSA